MNFDLIVMMKESVWFRASCLYMREENCGHLARCLARDMYSCGFLNSEFLVGASWEGFYVSTCVVYMGAHTQICRREGRIGEIVSTSV